MKTKERVISILVFIVPISIVLLVMWLFYNPTSLPEFTILNGEHFFEISSNEVCVLHEGNKLKLVIDDRVYWIRLEVDGE